MTEENQEERRARRQQQRSEDADIALLERAAKLQEIYILDSGSLLDNAPLDTPFVIDQVMPDQGICFLAGRPGAMKSWLAYDAALAVARGRPWLAFDVPESGKVLVLNFDNPSHELGRRFRRLGLSRDDPIFFHSPAAKLPPEGLPAMLQLPHAIEAIMLLLQRIRPHLVIIDSYRQSHTGEEHSSSDMGRVMSCLRSMTGTGAAILVLHHLRKQGQQKDAGDDEEFMRGSTEIEASADAIMLVKDGVLELKKTRGWKPTTTKCDYLVEDPDDETTIVRARGELSALEAVLEDGPLQRREIQRALTVSAKVTDQLIQRGITAGLIREKARRSGRDKRLIELIPEDEDDE